MKIILSIVSLLVLIIGCQSQINETQTDSNIMEETEYSIERTGTLPDCSSNSESEESTREISTEDYKSALLAEFIGLTPNHWGETVPGVKNRINTNRKLIALTFDACGGSLLPEYDEKLIDFLIEEQIRATLFLSGKWIDNNKDVFLKLSQQQLFEIANHGHRHLPLSITGKSAYGIKGTNSLSEVFDEVYLNQKRIEELTGHKPIFFRSGTAYYDEIAVEIVHALGLIPVNYSVLGDAGATFSQEKIYKKISGAKPGDIILLHMNKPDSDVASGVKQGVEELRRKGFDFVKLGDYIEYLE